MIQERCCCVYRAQQQQQQQQLNPNNRKEWGRKPALSRPVESSFLLLCFVLLFAGSSAQLSWPLLHASIFFNLLLFIYHYWVLCFFYLTQTPVSGVLFCCFSGAQSLTPASTKLVYAHIAGCSLALASDFSPCSLCLPSSPLSLLVSTSGWHSLPLCHTQPFTFPLWSWHPSSQEKLSLESVKALFPAILVWIPRQLHFLTEQRSTRHGDATSFTLYSGTIPATCPSIRQTWPSHGLSL